jgi:hypothetical protein
VSCVIEGLVIYTREIFPNYRTWLHGCFIFIMGMMVFVEVVHLERMPRDPFLVVAKDIRTLEDLFLFPILIYAIPLVSLD